MSSPIDLNLDFQDYTPSGGGPVDGVSKDTSQSAVQIKIPDNTAQQLSNKSASTSISGTSGSLFQSLLQGSTNLPSSGMLEESMRQTHKLRQRSAQTKGFSWGLNYLSQYFDVDTNEVLERILWSAIPVRIVGLDLENVDDVDLIAPLTGESSAIDGQQANPFSSTRQRYYSYMESFIQSRPDFYGPFWVSATLVFVVAIFSNLISFLDFRSKIGTMTTSVSNNINRDNVTLSSQPAEMISSQFAADLDKWHYSMDELNTMSSVIMIYVSILPTFVWFLFWFRGCNKYYTLAETVCAYGYSLSIFIPLTLLLTIQAVYFRYLVLTLAATLSALVLTLSFLPIVRSDPQPAGSLIILALVPLCHFGLAYLIHRAMLL